MKIDGVVRTTRGQNTPLAKHLATFKSAQVATGAHRAGSWTLCHLATIGPLVEA